MKNRHTARRLLALLFVVCFCIGLVPLTASAATTPYYRTYGTSSRINPREDEKSGPPDIYDVYMYGSSSSGSGTLYNGSVLNWDYVTIYLKTYRVENIVWFRLSKGGTDYIFNKSVNGTGGASRTLYSGSLPDGSYTINVIAWYKTKVLFIETLHEYSYYFDFVLDKTAPTISGASTSVRYTNSSFTVSASDATSGIKTFWYAKPGDQYFKAAPSNSITIPQGSAAGYYHFYATDNAGNSSATHYVYYDGTSPTGLIKNTSGTTLSGGYTNGAFYYTASDADSGVSYMQYRTPSSSNWTAYSGSTISTSAADGYYQFRATDIAGNISVISGITLDSTAPSGTLYGGIAITSNGGSIVADYVKFVPTDATSGVRYTYVKKPGATSYSNYTSGSQLTTKGTYSFYSVDYAGNTSSTYTITLLDPAPAVPQTYTVSYNANGGNNAPSPQTKTKGIPLTLTTAQPTRTGYTFLGWSASASASYPGYYSGGSYTADASVTLYAVWERNTYTVSYNANGGSGAPSAQIKYYGTTLTLSTTQPYRSGYTFTGWSTSSTASTPSYYAGGYFYGDYSITLYAVWSKNASTYTVSYNANGGTGAPLAQIKTENATLYLSSTVPSRSHYSFLGWATSASSQTVGYSPGDAYTVNSSITLYAVWQYAPEAYTISYNANGGTGSPAAQTKTEGVALTLSNTRPTRAKHTFLGWSASSSAAVASYSPGGSYTENASATLYAVWEKDNYEFSISNLTVEESDIYRFGTATVRVRTDSWDMVNAYSDIPVQLYYDGKLIGTQYANFAPYGVANLTFTVNVGSTEGEHSLEARINWSDRYDENDSENNSVTGTLTVKDYEYEMSAHSVIPASDYYAGTTVISSFTINNDNDFDVTPGLNNTAKFTAYYYSGSSKVVISSQTWSQVVIPGGGTNLVYFKWDVPLGIAGKTVYCECTINGDGNVNEANRTNNTVSYSTVVKVLETSQTPDTQYESTAPSEYAVVSAPSISTGSASWNQWVYENGQFRLVSYGVRVTSANPALTPGNGCKTATYSGGKWNMKSGYGIDLSWNPGLTSLPGYTMPGDSAYTVAQNVYATIPEYRYLSTAGKYRTLESVGGSYQFVENTNANGNERIHFIPVYVKDGGYTVSVTATQIWTPAGMITAIRNSNTITIKGTIYDDYYH